MRIILSENDVRAALEKYVQEDLGKLIGEVVMSKGCFQYDRICVDGGGEDFFEIEVFDIE